MGQDVCQLVIGWQIYRNLFREYENKSSLATMISMIGT